MTFLTTTSFETVEQRIIQFEDYLASHGVRPHPKSALGAMLSVSRAVVQHWEAMEVPSTFATHEATTEFSELFYLSDLLLETRGSQFETRVISRLKELSKGDPGPLAPARRSLQRDKAFEVLCAAISSRFASDVAFEEPDVTFYFQGARWAMACKAVYGGGDAGERAIRKGISQLEKSSADHGIVVLQMTNVFPHEQMYRRDKASNEISSYHHRAALEALFHENVVQCCEPYDKAAIRALRSRKSARARGVLFVCQTVAYWRAMRVTLSGCQWRSLSAIIGPEWTVFMRFNDHLQQPAKRTALHSALE